VGRFDEAIALMEPALAACPWNREWREDLARACECAGRIEQAAQVRRDGEPRAAAAGEAANEALADPAVNDAHASRAAA
jgi:predicted Zn-dependent protease